MKIGIIIRFIHESNLTDEIDLYFDQATIGAPMVSDNNSVVSSMYRKKSIELNPSHSPFFVPGQVSDIIEITALLPHCFTARVCCGKHNPLLVIQVIG
jgi:hypothetical protein